MILQTRGLGAMLDLSAMQIEESLLSAESRVAALSGAVAAIAGVVAALPASVGAPVTALRRYTQEAMVAMQYHDELVQRLSHVRDTLGDMKCAVVEPGGVEEWHAILNRARRRLSIEDERLLFDKTMAWAASELGTGHLPTADGQSDFQSGHGHLELF